jgi:ABC-type phosphate transport system auxiliary subunit
MSINILEIINWTSSMISIVCAVISFSFLLKNKTIRSEIINRKNIEEYSTFISRSYSIVEKIRKYTRKNKLQVYNIDNFIESLKNYYELVKSIENKLDKNGSQDIKQNISELEKDIQFFSDKNNAIFINNLKEINKTYFSIIRIHNIIKTNSDRIIY